MDNGYIKVPRAIMKYAELGDCEVLGAYINLLRLARFRETCIDGITVGVNQLLITKTELAAQLNFTVSKLRRILRAFEEIGGIRCENIRNKYTRITLLEPFLYGSGEYKGEKRNPPSEMKADVNVGNDILEIEEAYFPGTAAEPQTEISEKEEIRVFGRFQNVFMTEEEYDSLKNEYQFADGLIEKFSASLMNYGGPPIKSHFAKLWQNGLYETDRLAAEGKASAGAGMKRGYTGQLEPCDGGPDKNASYSIAEVEARLKANGAPHMIFKRGQAPIPVTRYSDMQ